MPGILHVGRDHTNPLFKLHQILPLEQLIKFSNVKFMHNYSQCKLPFSFSEMWITNRNRNPNVELRNADDFYVPAHRMAGTATKRSITQHLCHLT